MGRMTFRCAVRGLRTLQEAVAGGNMAFIIIKTVCLDEMCLTSERDTLEGSMASCNYIPQIMFNNVF